MAQSKPETIRKLRAEVAAARARGESDGDIIEALTKALTPQQLVDLHAEAVRQDRQTLEGAIQKALIDRTSQGAVMGSNPASSRLTAGAGTWSPVATEKPVEKSGRQKDEDARDDQIAKNMVKVRNDIYGGTS